MDDVYEFLALVTDILGLANSDGGIDDLKTKMINIIETQAELSKGYLKAGCL